MLTTTAPCPRCGFEHSDDAPECARCGVVFRKWEVAEGLAAGVSVAEPAAEAAPEPGLGRAEARMLGLALLAAAAANALPFVRAVLGALVTLFHESGHAAVARRSKELAASPSPLAAYHQFHLACHQC